ncbi:hypothetical protein CDAR_548471 [Caerostris darwini]|uniref:Uncharacterized protein n=1 Tax=Caerostris darwini TaxID=1538125 RepID=A0AAV4WLM1_9ARAC|nr:hypothetical protein CDAR_548471 [Caerostris darwini]
MHHVDEEAHEINNPPPLQEGAGRGHGVGVTHEWSRGGQRTLGARREGGARRRRGLFWEGGPLPRGKQKRARGVGAPFLGQWGDDLCKERGRLAFSSSLAHSCRNK